MPTNIDRIRSIVIDQIIEETPTVKTFIFKDDISSKAKPGQFLMVWIPGVEELPMSVMVYDKKGYAAITIRKHGFGSTALFNKRYGELLGVRGPYGNQFKIDKESKKALLVGGGTGLVPLMRLTTTLNELKIDTTVIIGAKSKEEMFFEKQANNFLDKTKHNVIISTEDGTYGVRGYATDVMSTIVSKDKFDTVYTCGPELMMKKVFDIGLANSLSIQASLERYMKCGVGICASCCIGDQLVCKDGTVFNEKQLSAMIEFGRIYRDKSGRKVNFHM
ncbi:MAG TPA: dihydroorotate dehydrogenase electron transfer subunit [Nitrososphaeraceae archaeon]|nr:dihydroorotate dehydrogenase electron transfer subunit [Nitrososphaeraceae archaeon]